ncbi:hypothetical protein Q9L58_005547 [Maublancomyces gigas]|uniref:Rhomboid-type serine protease n=1 Tax=Discina gigas TaxID=1032678 RepID=A0ABR3GHU0_9PEZI
MSAAEYYNSGPDAARLNTNLPPIPPSSQSHSNSNSNSHTDSPSSPTPSHSTASPVNKPLPLEPSFPPTHSVAGYDDGFFGRHHSTQSIDVDTSYHPSGPSHGVSYSNDYDKHEPYHDGIPLNDTHPQHAISAAEAGQHGNVGSGAPKRKHRPAPFFKSSGRRPWVCWILSAIQISVFIAEIARNAVLTGSPIAIKPQINPMIGPSTHVLINMGARFVPCMKIIEGVTDQPDLTYPCPNTTTTESGGCSLADWCGFGGNQIPIQYGGNADRAEPDQWWRFITPIFLHAGIIHIAFNMMFQLRLGVDMERDIGPIRFTICYFASGIFGFVFGGNFAPNAVPSTGCSGSLFGIIALILLDLLWNWSQRESPGKELFFLSLDIIIGFVIGLFPGLDNFSHIGGFLMGLTLGVAVLHSPQSLRSKIGANDPPYTPMHGAGASGIGGGYAPGTAPNGTAFLKNTAGFFKGRKPLWWAFWIVRAAMCATALIVLIVLANNFYTYEKKCGWCKYLSCLPVSNWCDTGSLTITPTITSNNPAMMLLRS